MELKPDYKQTEVGVIPEDWDVATVSDACDLVVDCKNRTPPFVSHSEFAVVRTSNVRNGRFVDVDLRFTDYESFRRWTSRATPKTGDIMLTREAPLGEVCAVPETPSVCLGQRMMLLRPSGHVAQSSYLLFTLMSEVVKGNLLKKIGGSTVGHAKVDDIRLLPVPLPPLEEQKHISAILLDVDNLVRDLESLIAKKQGVKQAAMQELLTGKRRLPGFEGEWEVKRLKDIIKTPVTDGPHMTPRFLDTGVPFLSVNNLVNNRIDLSDLRFISEEDHRTFSRKCKPQKGDILLGKAASVGKVAIVESVAEFNIWSPIALVRIADNDSPKFIYYALQSRDLASQISLLTNSSSQGNIGMGDIEKLSFRLPEKEEQTAIASALSELDAELAGLEARMEKAQQIKQGMMQQLLTGKIRLT